MWSQVARNDFQGAEVHLHSGQRTCEVLRLPLQECASAPAFTPAVLERQCGFDPGAPEIFLVTPGKIRVEFIVKELSVEGETEPHPETSRKPVMTCKACDFATINEVCVANVSFFLKTGTSPQCAYVCRGRGYASWACARSRKTGVFLDEGLFRTSATLRCCIRFVAQPAS